MALMSLVGGKGGTIEKLVRRKNKTWIQNKVLNSCHAEALLIAHHIDMIATVKCVG